MKTIGTIVTLLLLLTACSKGYDGKLILVKAEPRKGFNFPYFLYLPDGLGKENEKILVVEPNNTGFVSDELDVHLEKARRQATRDYYIGNYIATTMEQPLLVPVFPRPEKEWQIYSHALDRDVMLQKDNSLERIDLQLIAMINDAWQKLRERGYAVEDRILMTGFSASGTFVNRFSAIHPDLVRSYAAGGLNGLLILPMGELEGRKLNYPIGTHDFRELFGKDFDSVAFKELPQFLYMGELDDNDAIAYDDGYSKDERELIHTLLGEQMQPLRWESCVKVYEEKEINAVIKVYEGLGHEHPDQVKRDIKAFFEKDLHR